MTQIKPQDQIDAIIKVTKEVIKSRKSARQFLIDAGIIEEKPKRPKNKRTQIKRTA